MQEVSLILTIIAASIGVNYGLKLIGVIEQFGELKQKGETPLYGTVFGGLAAALIAESVFAFFYTKLYFWYIDIGVSGVLIFAISLFLLKNVVAHWTAYGYWAIVVKKNEKKFKESLKRDIKKMGGEA